MLATVVVSAKICGRWAETRSPFPNNLRLESLRAVATVNEERGA